MIIVVYVLFAVLLTIVIVLSILTCISVSNEEEIDLETTEKKKEPTKQTNGSILDTTPLYSARSLYYKKLISSVRSANRSYAHLRYKTNRDGAKGVKVFDEENAKVITPHKSAMSKMKD